MYILGLFLTPLNYFIKDWVRKNKITPLWWFLNDTEPYDKNDKDWGDFGRFNSNFIGFYRQNALRNSHWNFRLNVLKPKKGEKINVKGELKLLSLNWNFKLGSTFATYKIRETKYFRYSLIKKVWKYYINIQLGAADNRYLFKFKKRKIKL